MWAKRKTCMRRLYCSLFASVRSLRARLSFHFFLVLLVPAFFALFCTYALRFNSFLLVFRFRRLELNVASSCKSSEGCVWGNGERCRSMNNERQCKCESERQQQRLQERERQRTLCERTTKQQIKQSIKVHKARKKRQGPGHTAKRRPQAEKPVREREKEKKIQLLFIFLLA